MSKTSSGLWQGARLVQGQALQSGGGCNIYNTNGDHCANIKGSLFKAEYKFMTTDGSGEMGSVSKKWGGMARELFTSADTYGVQINGSYADDTRMKTLILGAALAIDAFFQKARGTSSSSKNEDGE